MTYSKKKMQRKNKPLLTKGMWMSKNGKYSKMVYYSDMVKFKKALTYAKKIKSKWCPA